MKVVVCMCRPEFENRGLRERLFNENGGLSELAPKKRSFGTKNNKETYFFLKGGSFQAAQIFRSCQGLKWGAFGQDLPVLSQYGRTPGGGGGQL